MMKKRIISLMLAALLLCSLLPVSAMAASTELTVSDNVIDITDYTVASWSRYKNVATNITIAGATVVSASEDGTTVDVLLGGTTDPAAELTVTFGKSVGRGQLTQNTDTFTLTDGAGTMSVTLNSSYAASILKGSVTYTINFSTDAPPTEPPTRTVESAEFETYNGIAVEINVAEYFSKAADYYLVEGDSLTALEGRTYSFSADSEGEYSLVFAAGNTVGVCADYVTVTVKVTEIKSGAWLGIVTSNGSVNFVLFTNAGGERIDGLTAVLEGTNIKVVVPRSYDPSGKIVATFDLTQSGGYPKLSTNNSFNGSNDTKVYTTTLSAGAGKATMYLYNTTPKATSNNYTTYTITYAIANAVPVLAEGMAATAEASTTADVPYTLDLNGIFTDPDEGDSVTGWKVAVNGAASTAAETDENGVYSFSANDAGEYSLVFTALDNYGAESADTYTVSLSVANAAATYDVSVSVPEGIEPTFYYTADASKGTELAAEAADGVYTVKVPVNVTNIAWRADGIGMNAAVSAENCSLSLVKPVFKVMADVEQDENASVTVSRPGDTIVGSGNDYLLLVTDGYTVTAEPGSEYADAFKAATLSGCTAAEEMTIPLASRYTAITVPDFAELRVGAASERQSLRPQWLEPERVRQGENGEGTTTWYFKLSSGSVYEYRVSVPETLEGSEAYVSYVGSFKATEGYTMSISAEQLEAGDKGRDTLDRDMSSGANTLDGANVADIYLNINAKGYLKLDAEGSYQLKPTRNWMAANGTWFITGGPGGAKYYYFEPDMNYSVLNLGGEADDSVVSVDENGLLKAVGEGTAIVLVGYDAMTLDNAEELEFDSLYHDPDGFYGAIWPENTGVFVVSVGAGESGIDTGMTMNEDKLTGSKSAGNALDSELDVIYFIGDEGEYSFTPGTEGLSVSYAAPVVSESAVGYSGFESLEVNADGSYTIPLCEGRSIVRLEKDGTAEYQVITAKQVDVSVNGKSLVNAVLIPGETVSVSFDTLYNPVNRACIYNTDAAVVYSSVSGWNGLLAGNSRGAYGYYYFASTAYKQTVANFVSASTDDSGYNNSQVTLGDALAVPADFAEEYFSLSGGAFNVGGFSSYKLGDHRTVLGTPPSGAMSENVVAYFGALPDISVPVAELESIEVTVAPDKTRYFLNDAFDPSGMVVVGNYSNGCAYEISGYTYEEPVFDTLGEKTITLSYTHGETVTTSLTVEVIEVALESIAVTTAPDKTFYNIGEDFDPSGMVVTAYYNDGTEELVTAYKCTPETLSADTTAVTVSYGSVSTTVPVTMNLVERIAVTTAPDKTAYAEGESFDPTGMVVTAWYRDGSSKPTDAISISPSGALEAGTTSVTVSYTGFDAMEDIASVNQPISVEIGEDEPQYESITVYMSFIDEGSIVVYNSPVKVYDEDCDGKYTIGNAFVAMHRKHYSGGASGYAEISNDAVSGWVTKFWGKSIPTFSYTHNNGWTSSTANTISDGDSIAAYNGIDDVSYSDLYTWFDRSGYTAVTGKETRFTVNGLNVMASNASHSARYAPAGADVRVFKGNMEMAGLATTVDENGEFTVTFTTTGSYTILVSGNASYGSYAEAPIVPSRCSVRVTIGTGDKEDSGNESVKPAPSTGFVDISGHWGETGIKYVANKGIMNGVGDNRFDPNGEVSRAMLAAALYRLEGSPETGAENIFSDVAEDMWYTDAIIWAAEKGIVKGYGEGIFAPMRSISRQEIAAMLSRYAEYKGMDITSNADLSRYSDSGEIGSWALAAMGWANERGLIGGRTETTLVPAGTATRAELAAILMRYMSLS